MSIVCNLWNSADVLWNNADWTWEDCQIVQEVCAVWNTTSVPWNQANWMWPECTGSLTPSQALAGGIDATVLIQPWLRHDEEPWNPYQNLTKDKQKRLIKLICKIKGEEYRGEKEMRDFKVTVRDVRLLVKKVTNIDLNLNLEE